MLAGEGSCFKRPPRVIKPPTSTKMPGWANAWHTSSRSDVQIHTAATPRPGQARHASTPIDAQLAHANHCRDACRLGASVSNVGDESYPPSLPPNAQDTTDRLTVRLFLGSRTTLPNMALPSRRIHDGPKSPRCVQPYRHATWPQNISRMMPAALSTKVEPPTPTTDTLSDFRII